MNRSLSFYTSLQFILYIVQCSSSQALSLSLSLSLSLIRADRMAPIDRQIKGCKTVEAALTVLQDYVAKTPADKCSDQPYISAMHICGKHKQLEPAKQLYQQRPSEACQRILIQICGICRNHLEAIRILRDKTPSIGTYNAAMAACGQAGAWDTVLDLLNEIKPEDISHTTLTYNVVLTALAKAKRGVEALALLSRMKDPLTTLPTPDRISYQKTIMALCSMGDIDSAFTLCLNDCPNDIAVGDIIISAYGKMEQWDKVRTVQQKLKREPGSHDFALWHEGDSMTKVGKSRLAYWVLGTWSDGHTSSLLKVALQPNRNPAKNGIKLLLLEEGKRIGYLLMINSPANSESSMLGAFLDPDQRKRGLSKILLGVWMSLCLHGEILPVTGIINKPLLALVLQETFGFSPGESAGVDVEISRGPDDAIVLFSSTKAIQGSFSPPDIKREKILFADAHAKPIGRMVKVQASFRSPPADILRGRVDQIIKGRSGKGDFTHSLSAQTIRLILLGKGTV